MTRRRTHSATPSSGKSRLTASSAPGSVLRGLLVAKWSPATPSARRSVVVLGAWSDAIRVSGGSLAMVQKCAAHSEVEGLYAPVAYEVPKTT